MEEDEEEDEDDDEAVEEDEDEKDRHELVKSRSWRRGNRDEEALSRKKKRKLNFKMEKKKKGYSGRK